jgi:two-component system chemotaxis response regulator CheY
MSIEDLKILITDDSILQRKQLMDIISTLGSPTFVEAKDGQDAIDLYKQEKPDLVFLDIVMPRKDGNAAIKEIIKFDPHANIIITSSVGTKEQLKTALKAGAKEFIQKDKPNSADFRNQILAVVGHYLERG